MTRCALCGRRIWPWQHYGFYIGRSGVERRWHASHVIGHVWPETIVGYLDPESGKLLWTERRP